MITTAELQQTPAWRAIHANDRTWHVIITGPPHVINGRTREYFWHFPTESAMHDAAVEISRTPHTTVVYSEIIEPA
jgi:hypothetical protein